MPVSPRGNAAGFTLVELMIATALGILVIGGVLSVFASTVRSNADMLKIAKLEEELAAAMTYMVRDIRRAGYNPDVYAPANIATGFVNAFDATTLQDTDGDGADDCLLYTYDADGDGALTIPPASPDERRGFRFDTDNDRIEERQSGFDCDTAGWQDITAPNVTITDLRFDLVTTPVALSSGGNINVRRLTITIDGRLTNDAGITRRLQQTVRLRNDSIT